MKTKVIQPNIIEMYDSKGKLYSYYWQRDPISIRQSVNFTIPWYLWANPIWRIKQYLMRKNVIMLGNNAYGVTKIIKTLINEN